MSVYQQLGAVTELIASGPQPDFVYPEFATITPLISDGVSIRNAVIQSTASTFREANVSWQAVQADDAATLRGYYESKEEVAFIQEDGTSRSVIVMDFGAVNALGILTDIWTVTARLIEIGDPETPGS